MQLGFEYLQPAVVIADFQHEPCIVYIHKLTVVTYFCLIFISQKPGVKSRTGLKLFEGNFYAAFEKGLQIAVFITHFTFS